MRRLLFILAAISATCLLAACGNKGPLYRPAPTPATAASSAPATGASVPAPSSSTPVPGHAG